MSEQLSYCGPPPLPSELPSAWNTDPWLVAAIGGGLILLLHRRHSLASPTAAMAGMAALAIAFVSPLCALSNALFAARTVHHLLLVVVAAPLLALAFRERDDRPRSNVPPLLAFTSTLWFWHLPAAYSGALSNPVIYWAMQISLLATAGWFWRTLARARAEPVGALLALLGAMAQMGLLGAILTFAPVPFYAEHLLAPLGYGLSPLEDQQLAGLIMWVPAMIPFFIAGAVIARRAWLRLPAPA